MQQNHYSPLNFLLLVTDNYIIRTLTKLPLAHRYILHIIYIIAKKVRHILFTIWNMSYFYKIASLVVRAPVSRCPVFAINEIVPVGCAQKKLEYFAIFFVLFVVVPTLVNRPNLIMNLCLRNHVILLTLR